MKTSVVINSAHPGGYIYHLSVIQQLHNNPGIEKKKERKKYPKKSQSMGAEIKANQTYLRYFENNLEVTVHGKKH